MRKNSFRLGLLIFLLNLFGQVALASELIVVDKFKTDNLNLAENILQKIKTIVTRQAAFDCVTLPELNSIISNNFPQEKNGDCNTLECILKFREKLHLRYLIEGEITKKQNDYFVNMIIYYLPNLQVYRLNTSLQTEEAINTFVLDNVYQLINFQVAKTKEPAPAIEITKEEKPELESEVRVKKETLQRLTLEKENLQQTLAALQEKYTFLQELAREKERQK